MLDGLASLGGGVPLPKSERTFFEPRFGRDFSGVRVHRDARAAGLAASVHARAFTHGEDIVFGGGHAPSDRGLLAHELAHVVQQGGGSPRLSAAPRSIQKFDLGIEDALTSVGKKYDSTVESVGKEYDQVRAAGFAALASGLRSSKDAVIGELNALADRLTGTRRDIARKIIGVLDTVIEVGILGFIFEVAADVGLAEGLAGMVLGLLNLGRRVLVYDYEFLKALLTGDSAEYERESQVFFDTISALRGALVAFASEWYDDFKAADKETKAQMAGTLVGQIEALILPTLLSGGAAGAARAGGAVGEIADVAGDASKVAGAVDAASDAGKVADAAEGTAQAVPKPSPVRLVPKPVEPVAPAAPGAPASSNVIPIRPAGPAATAARGGSFERSTEAWPPLGGCRLRRPAGRRKGGQAGDFVSSKTSAG